MSFHRTQINRKDWFTLVLVLGVTVTTAGAVAAAGWAEDLSQVTLVAVFSTALGMLLARTRFNEFFALLLSALYALFFVAFISAGALSPELTWQARLIELTERIGLWFKAALTGGASHDNLVFVVFMSLLFWFLGHNTAWHVFRLERVGRAVAPPAIVLLVNNFFYEGPLHVELFLIAFLAFVLLLAVHSHLETRRLEWRFHGVRYARSAALGFFRVGLMLAVILLVAAWALPAAGNADRERFLEQWREGPFANLDETLGRLFADLERNVLTTVEYYGGDTLALGGPVSLGNGAVMYVESDPPGGNRFYWRSRVYDAYDGRTWDAEGNARSRAPAGAVLGSPQYLGQQHLFQRMTWLSPGLSGLLYVAQEPYQLGLAAELDLILEDDFPVSTSAILPNRPLRLGDYYEALSLVSRASPSALRVAGANYPEWVTAHYLSLPHTVTQRTRDLALQIVNEANAVTPYDQALAIESWLRREIRYDERALAPPPDREDFVDWVLFDLREGYCTYYASAMVVMLRSLGVPARFVAGFAQGDWDPINTRYVVRENDAHTWVEVFFPGYGWIEFEPTAIRALPRGDGLLQATPTPTATLTPAPGEAVATVFPNATEGVTTTPEAGAGTPTPGAPLTPTPDPSLPPLQSGSADPGEPSAAGPVLAALLALSALALGALGFWLFRARSANGLSPVGRAYARLYAYARWLGVRPPPSETPSERARRLMQSAPQASHAILQITEWYNIERYRRSPAASAEAVQRTWQRARRTLIRRALAWRLRRRR